MNWASVRNELRNACDRDDHQFLTAADPDRQMRPELQQNVPWLVEGQPARQAQRACAG
jgi:hypothetical protein